MKTTLYLSENVREGEYPYAELERTLKKLGYNINPEEKSFSFEKTQISYKLRYRKAIRKYVLTFSLKRPESQLTTKETTSRYKIICFLIDKLPDVIKIGDLNFKRAEINDFIDIGKWKIKNPFTFEEVSIFDEYDYKKLSSIYKGKINLKPVFFILDQSITSELIIEKLKIFFSQPEELITTETNLVRDKVNDRNDKNRIFLFLLYNKMEEDKYIKLKKFFLQNNIPSQFINMYDKNFWFKTKNLIPEILTKASYPPFTFPEGLSNVDGYICLNDIYDKINPLFGINITYNTEKNLFKNKVKIYSDIKFESNRFRINFLDKDIKLLAEKIISLSPELAGKKINVYLTKYWKYENLQLLINKLTEKQIKVNKIFYISFFSDKFVFEGLDSLEKTKIPYLIIDKYVAYLQPNTKIGLFGSLFPISLELANSDNNEIKREDVEEYLWLIKRRVYRLQYIDMLRYPEFVQYSKKIRELNLSEEDLSQLTLDGDLLI